MRQEMEKYRFSCMEILKTEKSQKFGKVHPAFCGEYQFADLRKILTNELSEAFIEGMESFGKKIKGFDRPDAILAGVESRTSSPVRIQEERH